MTYTEKRFEDYLETVCFEANPSVLDDDMPDFFDTWLGNQDVEDMIRHCNNFLSTSISQALAEERERVRDMTYTEKRLEEFDEKFDRVVLENPFSDTEELSNELLTLKKWAGLFLATSIAQARAEAFAEVEKGLPKEKEQAGWEGQRKNLLATFEKYPALISDLLDSAYLCGIETTQAICHI